MIKVTTQIVMNALQRRGVAVEVVTEDPFVLLRYYHQGVWHLLRSTMPAATSALGRTICDQKRLATVLAQEHGIPTPETVTYRDFDQAKAFMQKHTDIVVKPADAAHGNGVTVGVRTEAALRIALAYAQQAATDGTVLLQQRVNGSDLRMLVIGGKYVATARRIPASVIGDGVHTLRQLIEHENATNPERGENDEKRFAKINLDAATRFLGEALDATVPAKGEEVTVVGTANIGAGGKAIDYTDMVTPELIEAAEAFACLVQVVTCGVDFIWDETTNKYYFIEANACPGFNLHVQPSAGTARPVDERFVDVLLGVTTPVWEHGPVSTSGWHTPEQTVQAGTLNA